jgi:transcriptional regulator GlxA family with amidase domain
MSRSAFAATFRQLTGVSPMRYVIRCRLGRAASCLSDGGLSVAEIARRTGYDSESAFTKAFTRQFGMPPSAYRRSLQEQSGVIPATREVD